MAVLVLFWVASLPHMSIRAGVVIAVAFEQVDCAPDAEARAEGDDQRLEHLDSRIEKLHSKTRGRTAHKSADCRPSPGLLSMFY